MGFDDEQRCLAVLQQNHGNLNRAVDVLLTGDGAAIAIDPPSVSGPAPASAPPAQDANTNTNTHTNPPLPDPKNEREKKDD
mmetsp:Transcript_17903/g.37187  ORF Transcript_17903/g.37187 Transcript_17903/m.37187 type:complete len:81 (-) Transcript_17903:160-402(-)